jgi:hypothetical protein
MKPPFTKSQLEQLIEDYSELIEMGIASEYVDVNIQFMQGIVDKAQECIDAGHYLEENAE